MGLLELLQGFFDNRIFFGITQLVIIRSPAAKSAGRVGGADFRADSLPHKLHFRHAADQGKVIALILLNAAQHIAGIEDVGLVSLIKQLEYFRYGLQPGFLGGPKFRPFFCQIGRLGGRR